MQKQRQQRFLDSRLFKAFMAAAETENFTSAAQKAFMTQSGVSQHIARLEEQVCMPLFKRIAKRVTLTHTGKRLKKYIEEHETNTEAFLAELRHEYNGIAGLVSYAMPASCLRSPHFPLLLEKRRQYPLIRLDVKLAPSDDVIRMVLDDRIDFGFVTKKPEHPNLEFQLFCQEEYILAAPAPGPANGINGDNIHEQPCIAYPGADIYFNRWLLHHFPERRNLDFLTLPITGNINSIDGAIKMVQGGLGISVFPRHCIESQLADGQLCEVHTARPAPLNDIHFVSIRNYNQPRVVQQVMRWFAEMHCDSCE
ncbi:MAG: LysR family transcriptional regulator [Pseudomonadota bacterium]